MYIIFERDWDYKWPSRAVSAYKKGWRGRVKKDVGKAAIKAGAAVEGSADDEGPEPEETLEGGLPVELAEPEALKPNRHVAEGDDSE